MNYQNVQRILVVFFLIFLKPLFVTAQIEEVIVTTQKRAESLQDVPISVQAFTGDNLDELGVQSAEEIMLHVPKCRYPAPGRF